MLDWVARDDFVDQFNEMLAGTGARVDRDVERWMPNAGDPTEPRLESRPGTELLPNASLAAKLRRWWLAPETKGNTPNWDLAASCRFHLTPGLVLVEAKANVAELKVDGKRPPQAGNPGSQNNHTAIGAAIDEARAALDKDAPGILIARDTHYQLSNRVAYAWKLAALGVPVVLVYLAFTGDAGIRNVGEPLRDEAHWREVFDDYAKGVLPDGFINRDADCGDASFRLIVRAREVIEKSAPKSG